jgi:16S rRNA processing protein RimM
MEELEPPGEDELFYHELLGLRVVTAEGEPVGVVREVFELRPADLLEVTREDGRALMVPFIREILVEADLDEGVLVIDPPEGLLEL